MIKSLLVLMLGLVLFQTANAQQDTLVYYMKDSGITVKSKDSADYYMIIMPADSNSGNKVYPVNMYYSNGKRELTGTSSTRNFQSLKFEGSCTVYYPSGKRKNIFNYKNGFADGEAITYYPNGQIYKVVKYGGLTRGLKLIECRDSTGNILAENGNGKWVKYDREFQNKFSQGMIKDSIEYGEWNGEIGDTINFNCTYKNGIPMSPKFTDTSGNEHVFRQVDISPQFKGGLSDFYAFLASNVQYPEYAKQHNIQGQAVITFIIEKNGTLSNGKILKDPGGGIGDEALRIVMLSRFWRPGITYEMPVRVQYTVPVIFALKK
jgi:TonB family protein